MGDLGMYNDAKKLIKDVISFTKKYKLVDKFKSSPSWFKVSASFLFVILIICISILGWEKLPYFKKKELVVSVLFRGKPLQEVSVKSTQETSLALTDKSGNAYFKVNTECDSCVVTASKEGYTTVTKECSLKKNGAQRVEISLEKVLTRANINEPADSLEISQLKNIPVDIELTGFDNNPVDISSKDILIEIGKIQRRLEFPSEKTHRINSQIPYEFDKLGLEKHTFRVLSSELNESKGVVFYKEYVFNEKMKSSFKISNKVAVPNSSKLLTFQMMRNVKSSLAIAPLRLNCEKPITVVTKATLLDKNASILLSIGDLYQIAIGEKNRNIVHIKKNTGMVEFPVWQDIPETVALEKELPIGVPLDIKISIDPIKNNKSPNMRLQISFTVPGQTKPIELDTKKVPLPSRDNLTQSYLYIGIGAYLETVNVANAVRYEWLRMANADI